MSIYAQGSCSITKQPTQGLHKFVLVFMPHLLLWDGLLSTQGMGRTTAPASPCCPFHCLSNGKWSPCLHCSITWASAWLDLPQSCQPWGAARSLVPQTPQPMDSVQERRGWSHKGSIAGTGPSKEMGSAWVWKYGYLIGPFFAPNSYC